jgi:hypothetical protein
MQHILILFKERLQEIEEQLGIVSNDAVVKREKPVGQSTSIEQADPKRRRNG